MPESSLGSSQAGTTGKDWPDEITDRIESVVGAVRSKTTVPIILGARAVVFGFVAGTLGAVMFILFVIELVRLLNVYLPWQPLGRRVWTVDAIAAAIFLGTGTLAWRKGRLR